jgi:hypothetical protein
MKKMVIIKRANEEYFFLDKLAEAFKNVRTDTYDWWWRGRSNKYKKFYTLKEDTSNKDFITLEKVNRIDNKPDVIHLFNDIINSITNARFQAESFCSTVLTSPLAELDAIAQVVFPILNEFFKHRFGSYNSTNIDDGMILDMSESEFVSKLRNISQRIVQILSPIQNLYTGFANALGYASIDELKQYFNETQRNQELNKKIWNSGKIYPGGFEHISQSIAPLMEYKSVREKYFNIFQKNIFIRVSKEMIDEVRGQGNISEPEKIIIKLDGQILKVSSKKYLNPTREYVIVQKNNFADNIMEAFGISNYLDSSWENFTPIVNTSEEGSEALEFVARELFKMLKEVVDSAKDNLDTKKYVDIIISRRDKYKNIYKNIFKGDFSQEELDELTEEVRKELMNVLSSKIDKLSSTGYNNILGYIEENNSERFKEILFDDGGIRDFISSENIYKIYFEEILKILPESTVDSVNSSDVERALIKVFKRSISYDASNVKRKLEGLGEITINQDSLDTFIDKYCSPTRRYGEDYIKKQIIQSNPSGTRGFLEPYYKEYVQGKNVEINLYDVLGPDGLKAHLLYSRITNRGSHGFKKLQEFLNKKVEDIKNIYLNIFKNSMDESMDAETIPLPKGSLSEDSIIKFFELLKKLSHNNLIKEEKYLNDSPGGNTNIGLVGMVGEDIENSNLNSYFKIEISYEVDALQSLESFKSRFQSELKNLSKKLNERQISKNSIFNPSISIIDNIISLFESNTIRGYFRIFPREFVKIFSINDPKNIQLLEKEIKNLFNNIIQSNNQIIGIDEKTLDNRRIFELNGVRYSYNINDSIPEEIEMLNARPESLTSFIASGIDKSMGKITKKEKINKIYYITNLLHNYFENITPDDKRLDMILNSEHIYKLDNKSIYELFKAIMSITDNSNDFLELIKTVLKENPRLILQSGSDNKIFYDTIIPFIKEAEDFKQNKNVINIDEFIEKVINAPDKLIIIKNISSFCEKVLQYDLLKKYVNQAEEKDKNLFKMNISTSNFEFEVLGYLDPYAFNVGADIGCCQIIGGAGENAVIDSFINPKASVVILKYKNGSEWKLLAESYVHYAEFRTEKDGPLKKAIFLDNIEAIKGFDNYNFNFPLAYATLAKNLKEKHGLDIVGCGTQFTNVISEANFKTMGLPIDPREFKVDKPYTDFIYQRFYDLLSPKFEVEEIQVTQGDEVPLSSTAIEIISVIIKKGSHDKRLMTLFSALNKFAGSNYAEKVLKLIVSAKN